MQKEKKYCKRNHLLSNENLIIGKDGYKRCKKCHTLRTKIYQGNHKEEIKLRSMKWAKKHPKRRQEILKKHRSTDEYRAKHRTQMRKYYEKYIPILQKEVLTHYGNGKLACVCCGESEFVFLTIDHINGRKQSERKNPKMRGWMLKQYLRTRNYPSGYQTLCWNCNSGRALNKGICPHKINLPLQTSQISAVSNR